MEIFKDIEGWEGKYQISNHGNVKSLSYRKSKLPKLLRLQPHTAGYKTVSLGFNVDYLVHRLVAQAFIANPDNKKTVNHKNGVKDDNHIDNLEWMTHSENVIHAGIMGWRQIGKDHPNSKKTLQYSKEGVLIKEYHSTTEASKVTGINKSAIKHCLRGRNKTSGGYIWKFKDNE